MDIYKEFDSRASFTSYVCLFSILVLANVPFAYANNMGYDENTEVVVRGTVRRTMMSPYMRLQCFTFQSGSRTFRVIVAPRWIVKRMGLRFYNGIKIEVVGSKFFCRDGQLCLLARSLKFLRSGRRVVLRDKTCRPIWQDLSLRNSSCLHIFYHSP